MPIKNVTEFDPLTQITEAICPRCGKIFCPAPYHRFKDVTNHRYYCSWTCFNHRKDKKKEKETI